MGIGADLKRAREEAGISLQAVSDKTKINIPFLEAIEKEEWSIFPSHTFAKGFLRAYAKMVKVDTVLATKQFNEEVLPSSVMVSPSYNIESAPIQTAWKFPTSPKKEAPIAKLPSAPPPPPPAEPRVATAPIPLTSEPHAPILEPTVPLTPRPIPQHRTVHHPRPVPSAPPRDLALEFDEKVAAEEHQAVARMLFTRKPSTPTMDQGRGGVIALRLLVVVVLLLLLATGVRSLYRWATHLRDQSPTVSEDQVVATPTEGPTSMRPVAAIAPLADRPKPPVKRPVVVKPANAPGQAGDAPSTVSAIPPVVASSPAPLTPAQAVAQATAPKDKYHHLILKGLEASWVLVVVDGRLRSEFNILPGQLKTFQAVHGFAVKLGNAAGVDAQYDGRSLGVLGGRGNVVDFVLPQGYQPPIEP
jgi:cytoskeletal protein RodZ